MSSLAKLSIRGVRAFSPDDDEQIVEFYFPFTIIVGQNGCGKTTIIECLKYAITGGLPPGNKSGQAFVHDPRQSGSKQTKATVKLRFNTRSGQPTVVIRSMELTRNKATLSFKQLDGVVRSSDPVTGARTCLSHKCSELDSTLPAMLGISKAILDNVLFCHQEEASWPLQEGAVLKKKFDDIFDSTRYTKALDAFRKKEKDLLSKCKDIRVEVASLESTKTAVDGYRRELRESNDAEESLSTARTDINKEIEQTEKDIEYYQGIVDKINRAKAEISKMQGLVDQHEAALDRQRKMVEKDLSETFTLENLKVMLTEFGGKGDEYAAIQEGLEYNIQEVSDKIDAIHNSEMEMKTTLGKLESEKETFEQQLRRRVQIMESIASSYNFSLHDFTQSQQTNSSFRHSLTGASQSVDTDQLVEISPEDMTSFFRRTDDIKKGLEDDLRKHKQKVQREEDVLQKELLELGGKLGALEKEKEEILKQKRELREEMNQLNKDMSTSSRLRRGEVEEAKKNAERLAKERDEANNNPRLQNIDIEIRQIEDKWDELKRKQANLKAELDVLQESAELHTEIATLHDDLKRDYESLEESVKDSSSLLCRFNLQHMGKLPELSGDGHDVVEAVENMGTVIRERLNDERDRLSTANSAYAKEESLYSEKSWALRAGVQALQTLHQQHKNLSDGAVASVRSIVNKIRKHDSSMTADETSPTELREYIDKKIEEFNEDLVLADPEIITKIVRKLYSLIDRNGPICPCCNQELESDEKKRVVADQRKHLMSEDSPLLAASAHVSETAKTTYQAWRKTVDEHSTDLQNFASLEAEMETRENANQQLEADVDDLKGRLAQKNGEVEDLKALLVDLEELAKASDRWKDASLRIGQKSMTIQSKRKEVNTTNPSDRVRERKVVDREYTEVSEEIDRLSSKKTALNGEVTRLNQLISQTAQQAAGAESRAKEKAMKFAATEKAMNRKNEILELQKGLADREKHVDHDIPSLTMRVKERESEKQRLRQECSSEEVKLHRVIQEFDASLRHLGDIAHEINTYVESDKPSEHLKIQSALDSFASEITELKDELAGKQVKLEDIRDKFSNQERQKRQLEYNVQIIEEKNALAELYAKLKAKKKDVKSIEHYATAGDELHLAHERRAKHLENKNMSQGRYSEIRDRIRSLTNKLNQPEFRDVDKKLRKTTIEYETTKVAADDLKKYQQALDSALLQFHAKKLAEINKIIRELWLMTYKGEDIANIVLQSGQEPGARAQKSYNYRVVMTKGTTELDMRGRCSAGQRVLACIVIRLALAESFGINCGCIALDEPTVNLDYENKKGLAIALAQIIGSRSQQRNFQLILITHDEEFVSMMKTELASLTGFSMPEKYFQVVREESADGKLYSKIHTLDWDSV